MTAAPPDDAVQETDAEVLPAVAVTLVTAFGTPADGVTLLDGELSEPLPWTLAACTRKVYPVAFVRPVTVQDVPAVVQVLKPGVEITV